MNQAVYYVDQSLHLAASFLYLSCKENACGGHRVALKARSHCCASARGQSARLVAKKRLLIRKVSVSLPSPTPTLLHRDSPVDNKTYIDVAPIDH